MTAVWNPIQTAQLTPQIATGTHLPESLITPTANSADTIHSIGNEATLGKRLKFYGEITGLESLFIDGEVEGNISLPSNRVTVGRNGKVNASISAREIVVMGKVRGNISASDRVKIHAEGAVIGDLAAARLTIEDGAFFKGIIYIREPVAKSKGSFSAGLAGYEELKEA